MVRPWSRYIGLLLGFFALSALVAQAEVRTWTDVKGRQMQAEFLRLDDDKVFFLKDGAQFEFPFSRLSPQDRTTITRLAAEQAISGGPLTSSAPPATSSASTPASGGNSRGNSAGSAPRQSLTAKRPWSDTQGNSVTGQFVRIHDGNVVVRHSGRVTPVPYHNLSAADQQFLREHLEARGQAHLIPARPANSGGSREGMMGGDMVAGGGSGDMDMDMNSGMDAMGAIRGGMAGRPGLGNPSGNPAAAMAAAMQQQSQQQMQQHMARMNRMGSGGSEMMGGGSGADMPGDAAMGPDMAMMQGMGAESSGADMGMPQGMPAGGPDMMDMGMQGSGADMDMGMQGSGADMDMGMPGGSSGMGMHGSGADMGMGSGSGPGDQVAFNHSPSTGPSIPNIPSFEMVYECSSCKKEFGESESKGKTHCPNCGIAWVNQGGKAGTKHDNSTRDYSVSSRGIGWVIGKIVVGILVLCGVGGGVASRRR